MKTENPIPGMYLRIAGIAPDNAEETRPRARLWPGTALLLSAIFAVTLACGPSWDDVALRTRGSRVDGVDCSGDDGVLGSDDDTCTGTTGSASSAAGGVSVSASTGGSSGGSGTSSVGAPPPPPPDGGVPQDGGVIIG